MFVYEKKLQYPVRIANPNPKLAAVIISQYGGRYTIELRYIGKQKNKAPTQVRALFFVILLAVLHLCALCVLPNEGVEACFFQALHHLFGVGAAGERPRLRPIELLFRGLLRLGGFGLLGSLIGHAEVVADAVGDGLTDGGGVFHDPLGALHRYYLKTYFGNKMTTVFGACPIGHHGLV